MRVSTAVSFLLLLTFLTAGLATLACSVAPAPKEITPADRALRASESGKSAPPINEEWLRYSLNARFSIELPTPPKVYSSRSTEANIKTLLDSKASVAFFDGCISGKLLVDILGLTRPPGQSLDQRLALGINRRRIEESAGALISRYTESSTASGLLTAEGQINFRGLPSTCTLAATRTDREVMVIAVICPIGDKELADISRRVLGSVQIADVADDVPQAPPARISDAESVLNGTALTKPRPAYPAAARDVRAGGTVTVELIVSETGRVLSAKVLSGPPVFYEVSEAAAKQWTFSPTIVNGAPAVIRGQISFNFRPSE